MSALAASQADFLHRVLGEREPDETGVAVYRSSVLANFRGALRSTYPVVARLVGDAFFGEAARRFSLANPSSSGDLADYGAGFAEFLAGYAPARSLDYLPDVARLEWACHECGRAPEPGPLDVDALGRVPVERHGALRFTPHPAVRLLRSAHPVIAILEANASDRDGTPDRTPGPDFVLVSRREGRVQVDRLDEASWRFVDTLARGVPLDQAAAQFPLDAREALLAPALARCVTQGLVCAFTAS